MVESPLTDTHPTMTAVADAFGNISNNQFSPDVHDLDIRFYLTATGSQSQAQNTFTDANNDANTLTLACISTTLTSGSSTTCTATETDTAPPTNNGPPAGTVSWSISPADGTFSPTSCTLGTPSGSSSKCSTTFTASSGGNATITGNYNRSSNFWANNTTGTLPVTVNQAPAITSANSTTFKVGTAGTFTVTASGFPASTFSETGALPSGVTFNGNTGVLSGTPAANTSGTYPITFTASNGIGSNATQNFTLTVNQAPTITSANSATFIVGAPGSFTVTATGFPTAMTFSETGALPNGVTLNSSTGVLSGSPTAGTAGSYSITLIANNGVTPNATQSFTLTVAQVPVITSANSATFGEGTNGTFTVTASGFPAPAFSEIGALPSGVTFNTATGVLSGTPAAGTSASSPYSITFTASNLAGASPSQSFTLTVLPPPTVPSAPVLLPSTTGNPEDNVTTSTTPSFYGTTTGSITTVTIFSDGVQVGSGSASNYANNTTGVSVTTPLSVGTHVITAKPTDAIGAVSAASSPLNITVINTIKQTSIGTANSGNSTTNTLTQTGVTVAAGKTIFVTVAMEGGTQTVTVSDNGSGGCNSYTKDADVTNGSGTTGIRTLIFSAPVTHALSSGTITICSCATAPACSGGTAVNMAATFFYFNGIVSPSPKDLCHTGTGNSTTPSSGITATTCTGTPATTSQADELLVGAVGMDSKQGNLTAGNSFTSLTNSQDGGSASNPLQLQPAYLVVDAAGQYAATWTYNKPAAPWAAAIVTYKIVFPTISSIVMAPASITTLPSTTNLNNVNFTVTFSEPVLGIDAEDFALDSTNTTVSGASITGVTTTDNTVYTVAVNTGTGNGTIQLNYHDDADVTVDGNNIPLNGSAAVTPLTIPGPTYTVSKSVATSLALAAPSPASVSFGSTGAVIFSATLTRTTGGAAVSGATVNFTVDGNAAVSGTTNGSGVATFSTYNPSALSVAGHNVQASFADATISGSTYTASTSGTQTLSVSTATVTVTFTAADKIYDGNNTATVSNCVIATGKVGSDDVTCSVAGGTFVSSNASASAQTVSATATLGGTKASNYTVTNPVTTTAKINAAPVTVTFTAADKTYDGNNTATVSNCNIAAGKVGSDDVTCPVAGGTFASSNASPSAQTVSATATLGGTKASNYAVTNPVTTTAKINPATPTVTVTDPLPTFDGSPHSATAVTKGLGGADVSGSFTFAYDGSNTAPTHAKTSYAVVATFTSGDGNYTDASGAGVLTIKQASSTTKVTGGTFTFDGSAHAASVLVTGAGSLSLTPSPSYSGGCSAAPIHVAQTTPTACTASYSFAGDGDHTGSNDSATIVITPAASLTTVSGAAIRIDDSGHAASVLVTGAGSLSLTPSPSYSGGCSAAPIHVAQTTPTACTASYSFAGDGDHTGSNDSATIVITPAASLTKVTGGTFPFDGSAHAAGVLVTGAGSLSLTPSPSYSGGCSAAPIHVAQTPCTASYSFAGDPDHTGSSDSAVITITQAPSVTTIGAGYMVIYNTLPHGVTANVTGAGGLNQAVAVVYNPGGSTVPLNPGTYTATATFAGDADHLGSNAGPVTINITYGACSAGFGPGDVILPPINSDGTSVYQRKGGSTIPVKFNVCGANGAPLTDPTLVFAPTGGALTMTGAMRGTITVVNETVTNDIPDAAFTWDGQQWHFNMATVNLSSGYTYTFKINLAYSPASITFMVGVK